MRVEIYTNGKLRYVKKSEFERMLKRGSVEKRDGAFHTTARIVSSDPARHLRSQHIVVPRLKRPGRPRGLVLQYPLKDDSSKRLENRRRIWGA